MHGLHEYAEMLLTYWLERCFAKAAMLAHRANASLWLMQASRDPLFMGDGSMVPKARCPVQQLVREAMPQESNAVKRQKPTQAEPTKCHRPGARDTAAISTRRVFNLRCEQLADKKNLVPSRLSSAHHGDLRKPLKGYCYNM